MTKNIYFLAQEGWLNQVLEVDERKNAKHTIIFQHIPWFFGEVSKYSMKCFANKSKDPC